MKLLIDIGNTWLKYCLLNKKAELSDIYQINHQEVSEQLLIDLIQSVDSITVASVEAILLNRIKSLCQLKHKPFQQVVTEAHFNGVKNGYHNYQQLGVDRWLVIIAAHCIWPENNCLIIDSGTATTFDIVDSTGLHHGGWILPGIEMMHQALIQKTHRINSDYQIPSRLDFGKSTKDNVNQGILAATIGTVYHAVENAKVPINKIVFSGGNGKRLQQQCKMESIYIKDLVFQGLKQYSVLSKNNAI